MASSACCDAGQPVTSEYTPQGSFSSVGDLPIYSSGKGDKGVVIIYDIFGFAYSQVESQRRAAARGIAQPTSCPDTG
jgi:hypothetical protein